MERSLLIVDDDDHIRRALVRTLGGDGYQIRLAASGQEALHELSRKPAEMVLSDQSMPGMSGIELLRTVRKLYPETLRMMLTGNADLDTAVAAINEGEIYRFLTKPWETVELRVAVRLGFDRVALVEENKRLQALVWQQANQIRDLEREHPGIAVVTRDSGGVVVIEDPEMNP